VTTEPLRVSDHFADFVHSLSDRAIPATVSAAVTDRITDTVAVGIAGSSTAVVRDIAEMAERTSASATGATVWGTSYHCAPATAALVNAAAVHAEDFDDTHTAAVVHGSTCIVPAALAAAETRNLTMSDVQRGVLAGWEVAARLGLASAGAFHRSGLHTTSVVGVFGAAAAVAAVWQQPAPVIASALGLAGSATSGLNVYLEDGTPGKLLNPAFAAQAGFQAASLAQAGVTGPGWVFEGRHGLYAALGEGVPNFESTLATLGSRWEVEQVSTKPYSACHFSHATIDAAIGLRNRGVRIEEIEQIICYLPEPTWDLLCRPWEKKLDPASVYAVRFSIPWLVALGLIDGDITRSTFDIGLLARTEVRQLATKVEVRHWDDSPYPASFPGRVTVVTETGSISEERLVNRGHPQLPLTRSELGSKFTSCVTPLLDTDSATALFDALHDPYTPAKSLAQHLSRSLVPTDA
jgi:2-methylcitrate dehydratase PrpD